MGNYIYIRYFYSIFRLLPRNFEIIETYPLERTVKNILNIMKFYFSTFFDFIYNGILVIKKSTASRAINPGKKRYMAFLKPIKEKN